MDIPILIFAMYNAIALLIGVMGIILGVKKIDGAPLISVIAGFMFLLPIIFVENITMGYTEERSILVSSLELAGSEGETITTVHMNTTTQGTGSHTLRSGSNIFSGEELGASSSLIGDTFNIVKVDVLKNGSPTGTAYIGVWDSTIAPNNSNYLYLVDTIDVSTISTSRVTLTFENTVDTYTLSSGEIVGIFYNGGSVGNHITFYHSTAGEGQLFDSTNSYIGSYTSSWTDTTGQDKSMAIIHNVTSIGNDVQIINSHDTIGASPINYAFNQNDVWVFSIVLGILFVFMAITIQFARLP